MELAVEDETHADAGADRDEGEGRRVAAVAVVALGDGRGVDVVLDRRLLAEQASQLAEHRRPLPSRQIRRQLEGASAGLDDARAAHDGMEQRAVAADACLAQKLARESGKLAHPGRTARRAGGPALAGADGAG